MMAHHPKLMQAWMPFRNHVVANRTLTTHDHRIAVRRVPVKYFSHQSGPGLLWLPTSFQRNPQAPLPQSHR
jgi:hypothetical protein